MVYKVAKTSNNSTAYNLQGSKMSAKHLAIVSIAAVVLSVFIQWSDGQATTVRPCTVNGRIATVAGSCNNTYYLCYNPNPNGNGNFSQWQYTCPGTSVFNEALQRCSTACATTTTTSTTTTTTTTAAPTTTTAATSQAAVSVTAAASQATATAAASQAAATAAASQAAVSVTAATSLATTS